jgi:hypothetical protein
MREIAKAMPYQRTVPVTHLPPLPGLIRQSIAFNQQNLFNGCAGQARA